MGVGSTKVGTGPIKIQLFYTDSDIYNYYVTVNDTRVKTPTGVNYLNPAGLTIQKYNGVSVFGIPKVPPASYSLGSVVLPVGANPSNSKIKRDSFTIFISKPEPTTYVAGFIDGDVKDTMVVFKYDLDRTKYNTFVTYSGITATNPTTVYTNTNKVFIELKDSTNKVLHSDTITIGYPCTHIAISYNGSSPPLFTTQINTIAACNNILYNPTPVNV